MKRLAAAIVERSGICRATVEAVLPHVFDAIRYEIVEGRYHCVPIESFGTFYSHVKPKRRYHNTYKGADEWREIPEKRFFKFAPTRNMRREMEKGEYDPSRRSFTRHPDDPAIRKRREMRYRPKRGDIPMDGMTIDGD